MLGYIVRRVLYMIPVMFAVSILSFAIIQAPPGDYLTTRIAQLQLEGTPASEDQILALRKQYSGSVAIPTYVVVDPNTLERKSRLRGLKKEDKFLEFLNDGLGR